MLILFYRRQFRELGYSRDLHKLYCLSLLQGRVAGLLRPRPFIHKLSNALVSRKFCERHNYFNCSDNLRVCTLPHMANFPKSVLQILKSAAWNYKSAWIFPPPWLGALSWPPLSCSLYFLFCLILMNYLSSG